MHFLALATDYDGTIAHHGKVDRDTIAALERVRSSGRKLLLVTGRELESLLDTFDRIDLFDVVVLENGALLYHPAERREQPLCDPPPAKLVLALRDRGVHPLSVGRAIVATFEPYETTALDVIRELGLEYQVIFNKGAVMLLPTGTNKATGLETALRELKIDDDRVVAIGDAENDHALLQLAGFAAAVANALPALKERADYVCAGHHGAGVTELIGHLVERDLRGMKLQRSAAPIPVRVAGTDGEVVPEE
jgi:hydroxymethylpyrimidine pyrophosphatase-like HAD family hydrolase